VSLLCSCKHEIAGGKAHSFLRKRCCGETICCVQPLFSGCDTIERSVVYSQGDPSSFHPPIRTRRLSFV
jgi:hypothetical protein